MSALKNLLVAPEGFSINGAETEAPLNNLFSGAFSAEISYQMEQELKGY